MFNNDLGRFRIMGLLEGASLIILLFVAMPFKYMLGISEAVSIAGALHGFLFIIYMMLTVYTTYKIRWSLKWFFGAVAAAFVPFGNFLLDRRIHTSFK
ncbi:DUF3817 domain-containing protein [Alkalicoccus daliensis]|uniref:Integral membrane protein n=1 Tax=Alkalicoccus daliensis TaxID=745820 RepID=A0A1H0HK51_9BACI|nr:DUF3817 domain-containing protein [Alkalicoccus daliensis]SDO19586.1 integral membrane protein [Alkalicoccus daliensis]